MLKPEYWPEYWTANKTDDLPELNTEYPRFFGIWKSVSFWITYKEQGEHGYALSAYFVLNTENEFVLFHEGGTYSSYDSNPKRSAVYWGFNFWPFPYRLETPKKHLARVYRRVIDCINEAIDDEIDHKKRFKSMYP